jgi:hypothetical protein
MWKIIRRLCLVLLVIEIAVLVGTSLPTWWGGHLGGYRLLAHMVASGVVVVLLPVYGILRWTDWLTKPAVSRASGITFWLLIVCGFLTIASMFACMLPSTSTTWMRTLIDFHGWIGSTMAVVTVVHLWQLRLAR